jgi:hypothetical protein
MEEPSPVQTRVRIIDESSLLTLQDAINRIFASPEVFYPTVVAFETRRDDGGYTGQDRYIAIVQYETVT